MLKKYGGPAIVAATLCVFFLLAFNRCDAKETLIGAGVDVIHRPGLATVTVYRNPIVAIWWRGTVGLGAVYELSSGPIRASIGALYLSDTSPGVGTRENLLFRLGYCWKPACVTINHISHAAVLGYRPDRSNSGNNFLTVEIPWTY